MDATLEIPRTGPRSWCSSVFASEIYGLLRQAPQAEWLALEVASLPMHPLYGLFAPRISLVVAAITLFTLRSPLLAASGPPLRTGLWAMQRLPEDTATFDEFSAQVRVNPNLSGVCLHIPWAWIEKQPGKPDFSAIDKTVAVFRSIGMKYQLCLKPGVYTPSFVYAEGAQSFETRVTNPHRANVGQAVRIPIPWDPIYERDFSRIIQRLGERYASDPLCVSVVLTCANFMSAEMHLPKTRQDLSRWQALGDYETRLLEVYKNFIDVWGTAFPKQDLSLHLSKVLDLPPSFCERVVDAGLSKYPNALDSKLPADRTQRRHWEDDLRSGTEVSRPGPSRFSESGRPQSAGWANGIAGDSRTQSRPRRG